MCEISWINDKGHLAAPDMVDWEFEPLKNYEITFVHQNDDWVWTYMQALDYHEALAVAFHEAIKRNARVHSVVSMTAEQVAANKASLAQRRA